MKQRTSPSPHVLDSQVFFAEASRANDAGDFELANRLNMEAMRRLHQISRAAFYGERARHG